MHDIILAFHVKAQSEFYNSVWLCVHAIHAKLKLPGIPFDNVPFLESLERGFRAKSRRQVRWRRTLSTYLRGKGRSIFFFSLWGFSILLARARCKETKNIRVFAPRTRDYFWLHPEVLLAALNASRSISGCVLSLKKFTAIACSKRLKDSSVGRNSRALSLGDLLTRSRVRAG